MLARTRHAPYCQSEDGAVLPIVGVSLAVFLGLVALSFDLGRTAATQSELQSFADHVALAAAGELDGNASAIDRAERAAAELIDDRSGGWPGFFQTFGTGEQQLAVADYTLTFHSALPALDTQPMASVTNDPANARYVRATIEPQTVNYTFARAFNALTGRAGPNEAQVAATAVAGFTTYACDITPLMFCVPPAENPALLTPGTMIQAQGQGGNQAWGPGNWGWLSPSGSGFTVNQSGPCGSEPPGQVDRCLLAAQTSVTTCFAQRGVQLDTGRSFGITEAALNTRFDVWRGTMNNQRNNPHYAPAPNTISGWPRGNNGCVANNAVPETPDRRLPRDSCFYTNSCSVDGGRRFGNADFAAGLQLYYERNYGGVPAWAPANPQTRYEVYLAEIEASGVLTSNNRILPSTIAESGRGDQCAPAQSSDVERRVLVMAGVDCANNPPTGNSVVPVQDFYRVFMTEPAQDQEIWLEIIGSASVDGEGFSRGIVRNVVQLYR